MPRGVVSAYWGGVKPLILTGHEILKRMESGDIKIDPFTEDMLNPNSVNLTLHPEVELFNEGHPYLDMKEKVKGTKLELPEGGWYLYPGSLMIARTVEYTETHNLVPMLEGRSSTARLGLTIHQTGGFGDIGYCGTWTLEISCVRPVKIYPNVQVCQICYMLPCGVIDRVYEGKYQGCIDAVSSRLHEELQ